MIINKFPLFSSSGSLIYGVSWDGTSTTRWTRTDAAANFSDPIPYIAGATNYGSPFDTIYPWSDMVRITDAYAGEMVKIPKFWYKLTQNGAGMSIQITDKPTNGFVTCPACMDRGDGVGERDYILVGRYHCTANTSASTNTLKSLPNILPIVSTTRSNFRSGIQSLGPNVYMMDWATRFTIFLLYLVEYADWNSQAKIGYGCGNNSATQAMGYTDSMPYHTGTTLSSRTSYGLGTQYRYIEGLWDNVFDWIDGCYNSSNGLMLILNPSEFSDNANGTSVGTHASGFPSAFSVKTINNTFPLFIPSAASGSNSTYSCDAWGFSSSYPCIFAGSPYYATIGAGLFCFSNMTVNASDKYTGSRVMRLPNPNISLINFTINSVPYEAEPGMTWENWVNSKYRGNTNWTIISNNEVGSYRVGFVSKWGGAYVIIKNVMKTYTIQNNATYETETIA